MGRKRATDTDEDVVSKKLQMPRTRSRSMVEHPNLNTQATIVVVKPLPKTQSVMDTVSITWLYSTNELN